MRLFHDSMADIGELNGLTALDLFAGAGGLSCGFEWAGGGVVGGVEIDPRAATTFQHNHPNAKVWVEDIRGLKPQHVADALGKVDVVIGGPMCQGVSQRGPRDPHDPRNFAFWAFADFVRTIRPSAFVMENVAALVSDVHNRALAIAVFRELEELGYSVTSDVVNSAWFGIPQLRYRLIVVGRLNASPTLPSIVGKGVARELPEEAFTTVGDALSDLPAVEAGGGVDEAPSSDLPPDMSPYARAMREGAPALFNHSSADTSDVNLERISYVREGGNWHDIPLELLPPRFEHVRPSDHTTTYRRLSRYHAAHTITTECGNVTSGAFTHPTQNRAITPREAARLQGFPDKFRFLGPRSSQYWQVGNAVPPLMAKQIFEVACGEGQGEGYVGRLSAALLSEYPDSRLPFVLAPRYKVLFGIDPGSKR